MTENLSMRQQKIARQIQRDMADIFSKEAASFLQGAMVTVTAVRVSPDFGYAKIYVSVFPFDRSQLKTVPEIQFFLDDSLEYIDNIDQLLREEK